MSDDEGRMQTPPAHGASGSSSGSSSDSEADVRAAPLPPNEQQQAEARLEAANEAQRELDENLERAMMPFQVLCETLTQRLQALEAKIDGPSPRHRRPPRADARRLQQQTDDSDEEEDNRRRHRAANRSPMPDFAEYEQVDEDIQVRRQRPHRDADDEREDAHAYYAPPARYPPGRIPSVRVPTQDGQEDDDEELLNDPEVYPGPRRNASSSNEREVRRAERHERRERREERYRHEQLFEDDRPSHDYRREDPLSAIKKAAQRSLTKFDPDENKDADTWLYEIEEALDLMEVPQRQYVAVAARFLAGKAQQWYRFKTQDHYRFRSWADFRRSFISVYGEPDREWKARQRLTKLRQTGSLSDYVSEFQLLAMKANDNDDSSGQLISRFIDGLRRYQTRQHLAMKRPSSLSKAVKLAREHEFSLTIADAGSRDRSSSQGPNRFRGKQGDQQRSGSYRQRDRRVPRGGKPPPNRRQFDGNCDYCGKYGHTKRECYKLKAEEERKKKQQRPNASAARTSAKDGKKEKPTATSQPAAQENGKGW